MSQHDLQQHARANQPSAVAAAATAAAALPSPARQPVNLTHPQPSPPPPLTPSTPRHLHSHGQSQTHIHNRPLESIRRLRASNEASTNMAPSPQSAAGQRGLVSSPTQRTVSMDSTVSSLSSSAAPQPVRSQSSSSLEVTDVPTLIAAAGSPEAAIAKLLQEKQSASAHTAQLWRLVEKQRAMILGLNKDLERTLKEKDKYRKRLKEQLDPSARPASTVRASNVSSSQSPHLPAASPPLPSSSSLDSLPSAASRPGYASTSASASSLPGLPVRPPPANAPKTPLLSDVPQMASPESLSSPNQKLRKEKPAPLDLSSTPTMFRDASDSDVDETPPLPRGRRKTRDDDDRQRESLAVQRPDHGTEQAGRRSAPPATDRRVPTHVDADPGLLSDTDQGVLSDTETIDFGSPQLAQVQTFQSMGQMVSSDAPLQPKRHPISLTVLSPGLPMSPRPGDRPMNSPMPRAPKQSLSNIPTSPRLAGQMPLSPRAPRQPIPLPPQTPLSFASPHLARAETYQALAATPISDRLAVPPKSHVTEPEQPSASGTAPRSPGDIYRGFMSDQYPGLLLPPNALPSIYVKVDSSRLRPSRHSCMPSKSSEENPVITLAVFARSDRTQLWRVEKSLAAMSVFDQQIKTASNFRTKLPDRSLFTGHAPARMDARRNALSLYFDSMLDTPMDDQAAVIICGFLTADSLGPEMPEYFPQETTDTLKPPVNPGTSVRKDGYLTKRGKNFGGWKARYFVLDGPSLKYFEAPGGAILGSIRLANAQIGKQTQQAAYHNDDDSEDEYRHAFLILEPKRKDSSNHVRHVLCAESDEERDAWVEALLQYVDQLASPSSGLIKQDSMNATRSPRLRKSMNDMSSTSPRHTDSSSTLRSIPYQATLPAEAPVIGPTREQASPSPVGSPSAGEAENHQNIAHPMISGPTNGTVIQNAESWGNKREPVTQTKDKKRSIFGFRGRSSSDTVPGGMPKDLMQNDSPTNVRPVFGAPLAEAVEIAPPSDVPVHLPAVVYRSIEYLRAKNASSEEGIFRLSGSNIVIKALRERFNTGDDVKLLEDQYYDIHAVASLLKLYLRELPASILTREHHLEFLRGLDVDERNRAEAFNVLVNKLPRANRELLDILSTFLREIVDKESVNKMGVRNGELFYSFVPDLTVY